MTGQSLFVLIVIILMIIMLIRDKMQPGLLLFTVVVLMMAGGVISTKEALSGFSNQGMITVALLFLVSEGISRTGALNRFSSIMLVTKKKPSSVILMRILIPISFLSAFLNNTPIVIMFGPMIKRWAESLNIPYKKLLIPLSYATILGGMCTLIGTTTNLVVHGMMIDEGYKGLSFFEVGKVGLPVAIAGLLYLIFVSRFLLPGAKQSKQSFKEDYKEYYYDVIIPPSSPFIGQIVDNGRIEMLSNMEVTNLVSHGESQETKLRRVMLKENDKLTLAGNSQGLRRIIRQHGLKLNCLHEIDASYDIIPTKVVEAVIGPRFPGIGKTLSEFNFTRHYGAAVIGVHRNGERINNGFDNFKMREGDNIVLLTDESFITTWGESSVFYLLSEVGEIQKPHSTKTREFAMLLVLLMILGAAAGEYLPTLEGVRIDMFFMAAITTIIMAWSNLFPVKKYTKFISWDILITIASAFAISRGMLNSGMADFVASHTIGTASQYGPHAVLAVLFLITMLFTEVITNNAAAALSFPIAIAAAKQLHVDPMPFFITICIAASASFMTPIGYQTNLIVQSIGNYKFKDYIKVGLPLSILVFILSIWIIPLFWKF